MGAREFDRRRLLFLIAIMTHAVVFLIPILKKKSLGARKYYSVGMVKMNKSMLSNASSSDLEAKTVTNPNSPKQKTLDTPIHAVLNPKTSVASSQEPIPDAPKDRVDDGDGPKSLHNNSHAPTSKEQIAHLEMPGWEWDGSPEVNDDSSEIGKIIFEITVDDMGFVIGIRTVQKTVSPTVEHIYMDALARVTFSRSARTDMQQQSATTTGLVTFVLKSV